MMHKVAIKQRCWIRRALVTQSSDAVGSLLVARGNVAGTSWFCSPRRALPDGTLHQILLNQISEAESVRNRSNNVGWTAEPLDRFFDNSLVPHVTVSGLGRQSWDVYAVTVHPNEHLSAGLTADSDQIFLEVLNSDEQVIASGQPGTNFDQAIREMQDRSNSGLSSVYYLRIRTLDRTEVPYSLSVFRNATIASNTTPTWFGPNLAAVGSLTSEATTSEFVFQADSGANINASLQIPFSSDNVAEPLAASLRLLGPDGQTVATGEGTLAHAAAAAGEYRLQVVRSSGQGGFELQVSGNGVMAVPIQVTSFAPAGNPTLFGLPESITVEFNQSVDVNSVTADDLLIGNEPAVFVRANSPTSLTFGLGPNADVGDGEYTVRLAANAVTNLAGLPQDAFETSFTVDRSSADYDNDGDVDLQDLDAYCVARQQHAALYDINQDGQFDFQDYLQILADTFGVTPGDVDLDGDFDSQDLVKIFEGGKYESGQTDASWQDGDFDCNGQVTSADFVLVFRADTYTANIARDAIAAADLDEPVGSAGQTSLQITPPAEITVVPAQQRFVRQRNSNFAPAENRSPSDDHQLTKNVERDHVFAEFQLFDVWL
ncbi:MAG: Ig-like domain-containing protein [Pirellulaceae bacterium]